MSYLDDYLKRAHINKEGREKRRRIRLPNPSDEARRRQLEADLDYYYSEVERNRQMRQVAREGAAFDYYSPNPERKRQIRQWDDQVSALSEKVRQIERELNMLLEHYRAFDNW